MENRLHSEQAKRLWASLETQQFCPSDMKNEDFAQHAKSRRFTMRNIQVRGREDTPEENDFED